MSSTKGTDQDDQLIELMLEIRNKLNRIDFRKISFGLDGTIKIEDDMLNKLFLQLGLETDGPDYLRTNGEFCDSSKCDCNIHTNCPN
jgi:hypothetical protein